MRPEPDVVTPATLRAWPLPEPGSDKLARGRIVVIGGTMRTPGAVRLAGEAALRAGAGKLSVAAPEAVATHLAVAMPESAVTGVDATAGGALAPAAAEELASFAEDAAAVLVGSGFRDREESVDLMRALAPSLSGPLVVDALASAYLTEHPEGLRHLGGRVVLAVNPTELSRTAGWDQAKVEDDAYGAALDVARRSDVVVLCGGEEKTVVTPDGSAWVIRGGGHGLAVSGSGDVQAGVVAGLLARGAEPVQAAVWGGYLHARAGERLAAAVGTVGFLARELPAQMPAVLAELA
jgi:ADP-dependent NAD(P)H-hydrate dehydratase